ncbi:Cupin domain protein [Ruegeria denitrificans]|uniref:Cupin domain protein n=1 Tax=Ruegeria denitrificans TaxID=1715692 RepID=A0A0N7MAV1_9RHOB|nr:cupin domain-containing protein [Ruegeria denitrificans]CUK16401.1 Cupin domain protein [Ruegeria denitrificans]
MKKPFFTSPSNYPEPLNVLGDKITVLARLDQIGDYAITLNFGHEGNGPPPHTHPWDETFFVVKGVVHFTIDGEAKVAKEGTLVHFPAGSVHSFKFGPGGAHLLEISGRGSQAVEMFTALDRDVPGPVQDGAILAEVLRRTGVELVE